MTHVTSDPDPKEVLLRNLKPRQAALVKSSKKRVLCIAGAGAGKTEVMARRVAWWVAVDSVDRDHISAITFTNRAAEEMKFRIREQLQKVTPSGQDVMLGDMYVGTFHSYCLNLLKELRPDIYYNFDLADEATRAALVHTGYHGTLGMKGLANIMETGQFQTIDEFLLAYDLLNEYGLMEVELAPDAPTGFGKDEGEWVKKAKMKTDLGTGEAAAAFATSAARFHAWMRIRRFLDFSTIQSELLRLLKGDKALLKDVRARVTHIVVDEVQDLNPVQHELLALLLGDGGRLTAVGDHRQAIFHWRGGRVELMAKLHAKLKKDPDGEVIELEENFRSTPRIIQIANSWADTITPLGAMGNPPMKLGHKGRTDDHASHASLLNFGSRDEEAQWIARTIRKLVTEDKQGARVDLKNGESRGIGYGDIVVLLRSSTDARAYMNALERLGIPAVFRAGPDLFSQPEVLLFVGALGRIAGIEVFFGGQDPKSLPSRIQAALALDSPEPDRVVKAAASILRQRGFPVADDMEARLLLACDLIRRKVEDDEAAKAEDLKKLKSASLVDWLKRKKVGARVFPQDLFHGLLSEAGVEDWETVPERGRTALFHVGQLSSLVKEMESPGWTSTDQFKFQIQALCLWGTRNARIDEAPLLVPPDAVTIATVHSVKGLEFPVVFLADVRAQRFPSHFARTPPTLPFDGAIFHKLDPAHMHDNDNYDYERRLMYVALTRAERYLFVTYSGDRVSRFIKELAPIFERHGALVSPPPTRTPVEVRYLPSEPDEDVKLVTSFSDLVYYHQCGYDFFLRKVLGFAPAIDQAFGYGRGVHSLMRHVHESPEKFAKMADDPIALEGHLLKLATGGLFYLRYTTGDPAKNMRGKAARLVANYVVEYKDELARMSFEPERSFETLIEDEKVLVSGAIDIVRLDDPPRVTIVDFKSGKHESGAEQRLDEDEMKLQISLYGLAAKKELEYEPERGLVRYLDETDPKAHELSVDLTEESMATAKKIVAEMARGIRERKWNKGPVARPGEKPRCVGCDFIEFCGMPEAKRARAERKVT